MPNRNYRRGVRIERKLKAELESLGWLVLRTAGSHGFADLIAGHPETGNVRFIQVKVTDGKPARAINEFCKHVKHNALKQEIWVWSERAWWTHVV